MGRLLLIDALAALVLVGLWYFYFSRYNRRKGRNALQWVEAACLNHARIVEAHWIGTSSLQARLRFAAHWFENAKVTIRLLPRPLPVQWVASHWRQQRETLTFEADIDSAPSVTMEVMRHRWVSHSNFKTVRSSHNLYVSHLSPVVLTTSSRWRQDLPPVINTLTTSFGHNLLGVRFRPESPHLAATVDLEALSGEDTAAEFLGVLRELAAGASKSRQ